ncbi:MAG: hypothetical protein ACOX6T_09035 [Myxococcales bacterium]
MHRRPERLSALTFATIAATACLLGCPQFIDRNSDASTAGDAGAAPDAGAADSGSLDAGAPDSGLPDASADAGEDAGLDACVPLTCELAPGACGELPDECGGVVSCACDYTHVCGATQPNACGCSDEQWVLKYVDRATNVGRHSSMARDAAGALHIAYADYYLGIKHAVIPRGESFAVTIEVIDPEADAMDVSLAIDASGILHVAYNHRLNYAGASFDVELWYAQKAPGGEWHREMVTPAGSFCYVSGGGAALRLDPSGGVHVFFTYWYYDGADYQHAARIGPETWDLFPVFAGDQLGAATRVSAGHPAFAIGPDGTLHAAFGYYWDGHLRYATRSPGGAWTVHDELIAASDGTQLMGLDAVMEADARGVHLAFWSVLGSASSDVRYGLLPAGTDTWTVEIIPLSEGETAVVGGSEALALNTDGSVHLLFQDNISGRLNHAFRDAPGSWEVTPIDSSGNGGFDTALLAEPDGLHVSYYEAGPMVGGDYTGKLRYAYRCRSTGP